MTSGMTLKKRRSKMIGEDKEVGDQFNSRILTNIFCSPVD